MGPCERGRLAPSSEDARSSNAPLPHRDLETNRNEGRRKRRGAMILYQLIENQTLQQLVYHCTVKGRLTPACAYVQDFSAAPAIAAGYRVAIASTPGLAHSHPTRWYVQIVRISVGSGDSESLSAKRSLRFAVEIASF
jgi:hypothetical protein